MTLWRLAHATSLQTALSPPGGTSVLCKNPRCPFPIHVDHGSVGTAGNWLHWHSTGQTFLLWTLAQQIAVPPFQGTPALQPSAEKIQGKPELYSQLQGKEAAYRQHGYQLKMTKTAGESTYWHHAQQGKNGCKFCPSACEVSSQVKPISLKQMVPALNTVKKCQNRGYLNLTETPSCWASPILHFLFVIFGKSLLLLLLHPLICTYWSVLWGHQGSREHRKPSLFITSLQEMGCVQTYPNHNVQVWQDGSAVSVL